MFARFDFAQEGGGRLVAQFVRPSGLRVAQRVDEVVPALAWAQERARAGCWVAGFVAYEAAPAFDPAFVVLPGGSLPLAWFAAFPQGTFSTATDAGDVLAPATRSGVGDGGAGNARLAPRWRTAMSRRDADAAIAAIRARIAAGGVYQVNCTTRLQAAWEGDALAWFEALRASQPDGYCAYLDLGSHRIASVSPELFFDWNEDGILTTRPMKGTAPRAPDPARDAGFARYLRESAKERAENLMIVDLLRSDLGRIARTGSVRVARLFDIAALPTVWQMTSTVCCRTAAGVGLPEVFAALFPCGSVTGAPKIAAMRAIAAIESGPRGIYCGAVGLLRPGGHATFNVAIRTVAIDVEAGRAECGIGSGITYDSTAAGEWAEWMAKTWFLRGSPARRCLPAPDGAPHPDPPSNQHLDPGQHRGDPVAGK